jgi:hypothetical protein
VVGEVRFRWEGGDVGGEGRLKQTGGSPGGRGGGGGGMRGGSCGSSSGSSSSSSRRAESGWEERAGGRRQRRQAGRAWRPGRSRVKERLQGWIWAPMNRLGQRKRCWRRGLDRRASRLRAEVLGGRLRRAEAQTGREIPHPPGESEGKGGKQGCVMLKPWGLGQRCLNPGGPFGRVYGLGTWTKGWASMRRVGGWPGGLINTVSRGRRWHECG